MRINNLPAILSPIEDQEDILPLSRSASPTFNIEHKHSHQYTNSPLNGILVPLSLNNHIKDLKIATKTGDYEKAFDATARIIQSPILMVSSALTTMEYIHMFGVAMNPMATQILKLVPIIGLIIGLSEYIIDTTGVARQASFLSNMSMKERKLVQNPADWDSLIDKDIKYIKDTYLSTEAGAAQLVSRVGKTLAEEITLNIENPLKKVELLNKVDTQLKKGLLIRIIGIAGAVLSIIGFICLLLSPLGIGSLITAATITLIAGGALGFAKYYISKGIMETEGWTFSTKDAAGDLINSYKWLKTKISSVSTPPLKLDSKTIRILNYKY